MVTFETLGLEGVQGELREAASRCRDAAPAWRNVAMILQAVCARCFETESSPDGERWAPLADSTLLRRAYRVTRSLGRGKRRQRAIVGTMSSARILQDRGMLRGLATGGTRYGRDFAEIGARLIYARTQFFGDASRHIPARPFLGISDRGAEQARDILRRYVVKGG